MLYLTHKVRDNQGGCMIGEVVQHLLPWQPPHLLHILCEQPQGILLTLLHACSVCNQYSSVLNTHNVHQTTHHLLNTNQFTPVSTTTNLHHSMYNSTCTQHHQITHIKMYSTNSQVNTNQLTSTPIMYNSHSTMYLTPTNSHPSTPTYLHPHSLHPTKLAES